MSGRENEMKQYDACECVDVGCHAHQGIHHCEINGTAFLYRVDMEDSTGTLFCEACMADALEVGFYSLGEDIE